MTAEDGTFTLAKLAATAAKVLEVDGSSLVDEAGVPLFGKARQGLTLGAKDELTLGAPVHLARLNPPTDFSD